MDSGLRLVCDRIKSSKNVLILTHRNPDGDTLGSAFALYYALRDLNINAQVVCSDDFPSKYEYLWDDYDTIDDFSHDCVVSVDIATVELLGKKLSCYSDKIDACIDHHLSNIGFAKCNYINTSSGANCENMYYVIEAMGVTMTQKIAECLYTGISTDTGCFKFSNTTPQSHLITAKIMETGFDYKIINKEIFETKSKARVELESTVINNIEFFENGKISMITIPLKLFDKFDVEESEIDGIASIPRQIEGVQVGITIREKKSGYRVSIRTSNEANANDICADFGGGGHKRSGGCFIEKPLQEVKTLLIESSIKSLKI